jgi:hypothetical protein
MARPKPGSGSPSHSSIGRRSVVALSELDKPDAVLKVLAEYDQLGEEVFLIKYGYDRSRAYWLLFNGKRYASKAVLGVAFKYQASGARPLRASEFAGGEATVRRALMRLGFTVEVDDSPDTTVLALQDNDADETVFDPEGMVDARDKLLRGIKARRGQKVFRDRLLAAYDGRCAISGCAVLDVLEAAHIVPYRGGNTHHPTNGLLLRADLHTLFDCGLFAVDPDTLQVQVSPSIADPGYRKFHGHKLQPVVDSRLAPSLAALRHHRKTAAFE